MASPKTLLSIVESTLLGTSSPTPRQRVELIHTLRDVFPTLRSFLSYPPPKPSDRTQVMSKQVKLQGVSQSLDDLDVQIALKLSDELNLNEMDCVVLLVSAHQEWDLFGREPLEIFRLAAGLWYTERRALITSLYTLLRAVVLDNGLNEDLLSDIQGYLEDLFKDGLRQRLITLMKELCNGSIEFVHVFMQLIRNGKLSIDLELSRSEVTSSNGLRMEEYLMDSRGALVERNAVLLRERLSVGHCLALSVLTVRPSPKDVKDMFVALKENVTEINDTMVPRGLQIVFSLVFGIIVSFISDALSTTSDKASVLRNDVLFRREFQDIVMRRGNDKKVEEYIDVVRLTWTVHLMLTTEEYNVTAATPIDTSSDLANIASCLELVCARNIFQILLDNILRTVEYQNDDEDMVYIYTAYLHKLMMCFLSNPVARDKIKELKEKALSSLYSYSTGLPSNLVANNNESGLISQTHCRPFVSLMELVSEIYEMEPEHLAGNEVIWTFVNFAGEDHTNFETLVAFLKMMSSLASNEEGAFKVYQLLQGKSFRSVGWNRLFQCLGMYEQKFKQSFQTTSAVLPEFQEGDSRAIIAYLKVIQKVMEKGNPVERVKWFPDIEPFFKLLGYENVPPFLKGALRNTITCFLETTPIPKDTIWSYLEQYDLPVVVGPPLIGSNTQHVTMQVYDMKYELNEVEAREERYPSTISFLNLLNALIKREHDTSDHGIRFLAVFRFIYDHAFGPCLYRAYAEPAEKWQLIIACLEHFQILLTLYDIKEIEFDAPPGNPKQSSPTPASENQIPVVELLKDCMSGRTILNNIMGILLQGVDAVIADRTGQIHGALVEKAVHLSLQIVLLAFDKDLFLADFWRPLYQPLEIIFSQDRNRVVALLEYVRYNFLPEIQQCSIKIMGILSSRMANLVPLLLESGVAKNLIEDYAVCLETHSEDSQSLENTKNDSGVLILQLLIDNVSRPAPNVTHLLLKFDVETSIERTILQPKYHYSCLRIVLDILQNMHSTDGNPLLHEFGLQLMYELCLDPFTGNAITDLLASKKYQFFYKHLDSFAVLPLPKRSTDHPLRVSSLQQRAWLLKLLTVEMHMGDMSSSIHKDICIGILSCLFASQSAEIASASASHADNLHLVQRMRTGVIGQSKVLELLALIQFRAPETALDYSQCIKDASFAGSVSHILENSATVDESGVYYISERGDRLIGLSSFSDKLFQICPQSGMHVTDSKVAELKGSIQELLRWGWRYNRNLEEQAAQLHLLVAWSQLVEVSISKRMMFLGNQSHVLFGVLDATLDASASPDCSIKMAAILTQVGITCMAKLREERLLSHGDDNSGSITCLDVASKTQLSSAACQSILLKIIISILRHESSELLRRRQYALLLNYVHYCCSMLDPDIPESLLRFLLQQEHDMDIDMVFKKFGNEQAELDKANFFILKKESRRLLDVIIKDAKHGSEVGRTMSLLVLDAFISVDQDQFFLSQLKSRGVLQSFVSDISDLSLLDNAHKVDVLQKFCTIESEIALLVRICCKYKKHGAQTLFSLSVLDHLTSWKALGLHMQGGFEWSDSWTRNNGFLATDKKFPLVPAVLRLILCFTSLIDASDFFEVKNKVVRDVMEFIKHHQVIFDLSLREDAVSSDDSTLELLDSVVAILVKVWPYDEHDEFGFVQALFGFMNELFSYQPEFFHCPPSSWSTASRKRSGLLVARLCYHLSSYLYFLVTKKNLKLQVSVSHGSVNAPAGHLQPSVFSVTALVNSITAAVFPIIDEKSLLTSKILDVNELSRYELDEIIDTYMHRDCVSASDNMQKRRHVVMLEMCRIAANRAQLVTMLVQTLEHALDILFIHFQDCVGNKNEDLQLLCTKLLPSLDRLSNLNEDKIGQSLKLFFRLVTSLKELVIQHMEL